MSTGADSGDKATLAYLDAGASSGSDALNRFRTIFQTLDLDSGTLARPHDASITPRLPNDADDGVASVTALPRLAEAGQDGGPPELAIAHTIGEGGMGIVRSARQLSLGREVAVKTLKSSGEDPDAALKLLREALVTGSLEHPNIIPVHALGQDADGGPMMTMKRVEGDAWSAVLADDAHPLRRGDAREPLVWHLDVLIQVCNAVHFAHSRHILHRDLKPDNVMIGRFGEVYVLDWGVAVCLEDDGSGSLPLAADVCSMAGTPAYMAPEMVADDGKALSPQTDVYLLGALLHEVLTGEPPHRGDSLFNVLFAAFRSPAKVYEESVPPELVRICSRAMAREPGERFTDVEEMRQALVSYLEHRASTRISDEAETQLAELLSLLDTGIGQAEDNDATVGAASRRELAAAAHDLYLQCAEGFRMATRAWPDNPAARIGLQRATTAMIELQIELGEERAATMLLAELNERPEALVARVAELSERRQQEQVEVQQLRAMSRAMDVRVGASTRTLIALALGAVWTVLPLMTSAATRWADYAVTHNDQLLSSLLFGVMAAWLTWYFREELAESRVNRQVVRSIWVAVAASLSLRLASGLAELPIALTMSMNMILFGAIVAMMAATIDMRLIWSALAYFAAGGLGAHMPDWYLEFAAAGNLVALSMVALVWTPHDHSCVLSGDEVEKAVDRLMLATRGAVGEDGDTAPT